ncbi:MAG: hypothetical protein CIT01_00715 [Methanobacterium sp. BRmetb2]|nr:MAG: hypothetical protein CIT01_00715 [Methanobacterium sp. BRmetb2]
MDPEKTTNNESIAPAEGERRAIGGYFNQYEVSAYIILKSFLNDSLDWIKVADPDAKHVDDFQICKGARLDAFQMKWSHYTRSFSFNDLIKKRKNAPSLIVQLAEGWKNFNKKYPEMKIAVHLITNDYISTSTKAKIPCGEPKPASCHFAAFINQAWKPFKSGKNIPKEWKPAWNKLQVESGLNLDDFQMFALDCELDFEYKIIIPEEEREKEIFINDLKDIAHNLIKAVADPSQIIKITSRELIEKLNWSTRTELRSRHEFPVDEDLYHPIKSNMDDLNAALDAHVGGYIGVFGTPGSGKSTFLSHFLRSREERVIFYYAYVPDSYDSVIRGESENFLHDITLSLRRMGFTSGENLNLDLNQLLKYFYKQLDLLHDDWKNNGHKTIFLIDGLDHIEREQNPRDSMLKYLPSPENIPQGVYFILGSQTETILPENIQYSINKENRTVLMRPLNKNAVFDIINKSNLPLIIGKQKETIYGLSDGHPLALSYILNHLKGIKDNKEIERILERTIEYGGNIEAQYNSYWALIKHEDDLIGLTGLLCRFRNYIDIDWVKTWAELGILRKFVLEFKHYFRIENKRWYFFHNSFRLFLQEKTGELIPGEFDQSIDRDFHLQMADLCRKSEKNSYWFWEEIFHLAKASKHRKVLVYASQTYFREQFLNFRPLDTIQVDINFALESAVICQDPVALTRLLFIRSEIGEREVNLDKKSMISILLHLNEKFALEYIRDGNHLKIEPVDALKLIPELVLNGFHDEAKKIFELSEPLNVIYSPKPIENHFNNDESELVKFWATSAIYFKELENILKIIRQLKKLPDRSSIKEDLDPSRTFQNLIIYNMGLFLIKNEIWDKVFSILNDFNTDQKDLKYLFYLYANSWNEANKNENINIAKQFLNGFLSRFNQITIIDEDMCLTLAEAFYFVYNDANTVESYLRDLSQPELQTNMHQSNPNMQPFMFR